MGQGTPGSVTVDPQIRALCRGCGGTHSQAADCAGPLTARRPTAATIRKLHVFLRQVEMTMRRSGRYGAPRDIPEGVRWIQVSETLAVALAAMAEELVEEL